MRRSLRTDGFKGIYNSNPILILSNLNVNCDIFVFQFLIRIFVKALLKLRVGLNVRVNWNSSGLHLWVPGGSTLVMKWSLSWHSVVTLVVFHQKYLNTNVKAATAQTRRLCSRSGCFDLGERAAVCCFRAAATESITQRPICLFCGTAALRQHPPRTEGERRQL